MMQIDKSRKLKRAEYYLQALLQAKDFIEKVLDKKYRDVTDFESQLRTGVDLCLLVNLVGKLNIRIYFGKSKNLQENKGDSINDKILENATDTSQNERTNDILAENSILTDLTDYQLDYRYTDNILAFINYLKSLKFPISCLFETISLYENKNFPQVVYCIHALSYFLLSRKMIAPSMLITKDLFKVDKEDILKTESVIESLENKGINIPEFSNVKNVLFEDLVSFLTWDIKYLLFKEKKALNQRLICKNVMDSLTEHLNQVEHENIKKLEEEKRLQKINKENLEKQAEKDRKVSSNVIAQFFKSALYSKMYSSLEYYLIDSCLVQNDSLKALKKSNAIEEDKNQASSLQINNLHRKQDNTFVFPLANVVYFYLPLLHQKRVENQHFKKLHELNMKNYHLENYIDELEIRTGLLLNNETCLKKLSAVRPRIDDLLNLDIDLKDYNFILTVIQDIFYVVLKQEPGSISEQFLKFFDSREGLDRFAYALGKTFDLIEKNIDQLVAKKDVSDFNNEILSLFYNTTVLQEIEKTKIGNNNKDNTLDFSDNSEQDANINISQHKIYDISQIEKCSQSKKKFKSRKNIIQNILENAQIYTSHYFSKHDSSCKTKLQKFQILFLDFLKDNNITTEFEGMNDVEQRQRIFNEFFSTFIDGLPDLPFYLKYFVFLVRKMHKKRLLKLKQSEKFEFIFNKDSFMLNFVITKCFLPMILNNCDSKIVSLFHNIITSMSEKNPLPLYKDVISKINEYFHKNRFPNFLNLEHIESMLSTMDDSLNMNTNINNSEPTPHNINNKTTNIFDACISNMNKASETYDDPIYEYFSSVNYNLCTKSYVLLKRSEATSIIVEFADFLYKEWEIYQFKKTDMDIQPCADNYTFLAEKYFLNSYFDLQTYFVYIEPFSKIYRDMEFLQNDSKLITFYLNKPIFDYEYDDEEYIIDLYNLRDRISQDENIDNKKPSKNEEIRYQVVRNYLMNRDKKNMESDDKLISGLDGLTLQNSTEIIYNESNKEENILVNSQTEKDEDVVTNPSHQKEEKKLKDLHKDIEIERIDTENIFVDISLFSVSNPKLYAKCENFEKFIDENNFDEYNPLQTLTTFYQLRKSHNEYAISMQKYNKLFSRMKANEQYLKSFLTKMIKKIKNFKGLKHEYGSFMIKGSELKRLGVFKRFVCVEKDILSCASVIQDDLCTVNTLQDDSTVCGFENEEVGEKTEEPNLNTDIQMCNNLSSNSKQEEDNSMANQPNLNENIYELKDTEAQKTKDYNKLLSKIRFLFYCDNPKEFHIKIFFDKKQISKGSFRLDELLKIRFQGRSEYRLEDLWIFSVDKLIQLINKKYVL